MPVLSGIELLQRAAEETPETVFIMLTNHQDFQLARNSLRYRSVDYLLKSDLDEATLEASLARAKAERDSRRRLAQASAVENYLESNRQSLLENAFLSVILTPPGASCASAAEVLQGNGVLNGYAAAYIPIRFDGIAGYAGFADNERARLFNWQRELCEKLAGNLFPAFVLLTPDAPAQSEALFLLCWDLPQDGWEGRLRTYADKLTAASATITQARPCVLGTRRFASGGELDECRAEVFALRDHYYLTGSETKMFYSELPAVEWGRLSLAGIADRLDAEVRSKNASACAVLLDRAIDRVRTVPHQKSQALWLCGEIRSALAARLGEEFGRSWPPIERLATRGTGAAMAADGQKRAGRTAGAERAQPLPAGGKSLPLRAGQRGQAHHAAGCGGLRLHLAGVSLGAVQEGVQPELRGLHQRGQDPPRPGTDPGGPVPHL